VLFGGPAGRVLGDSVIAMRAQLGVEDSVLGGTNRPRTASSFAGYA
jgi:hypothetical protein